MKSFFQFLLFPLSLYTAIYSQSMSVDMNPNIDGIQDTLKSTVSGEEFIVEFIGSNFTNVSGYQFKVVFDSTRFAYLDGDKEYGMSGKKNILKGNGGAITGIFQKQANPACDSILEVAYTINGTANLSVSGTGLLGIAQFKSKLKQGESGAIKIIEGYLADFTGVKTQVTTYSNGIRFFPFPVAVSYSPFGKQLNSFSILCSNNTLYFQVPSTNKLQKTTEINLYDLKGRLEAVLINGFLPAGRHTISIDNLDGKFGQGFHVCAFRSGNETWAEKIFIGK
jgi:hypothetical protein